MAHFSRVRAFGLWVLNSVLLPAEVEALDANQSKAINGDEGGVWAPSSLIEIGGSGAKVTGPFTVTSEAQLEDGALITGGNLSVATDANIQGDATVGGTLDVAGETTISDDLNVTNDLAVQGTATVTGAIEGTFGALITGANVLIGEDLTVQGDLTTNGALDVDGNAAIGGTLGVGNTAITGTLSTTGNASLGGTLAVTGDATLSGTTIAKGRFRRRVLTMGNAGATVSVSDYDQVFMPSGVMSADRTLDVSTTGAAEGDVIRVATNDSTYNLTVDYVFDAATLRVGAGFRWIEVTFISGAWQRTGIG